MFDIFLVVVIFFVLSLVAVLLIILYFNCQRKKERELNNYGNRPSGGIGGHNAIELQVEDIANLRNANEPGFEASYDNKSNMVNVDELVAHQKHKGLDSTDRRNNYDDFNIMGLPEMSESPRLNNLKSHEGFFNDRRSGSFERPTNPN